MIKRFRSTMTLERMKRNQNILENGIMEKLIRNAIQTPDGTILQSRHRHDYQEYTDANGKTYMTDGGLDYQRTTVHDDQVDMCVYSTDSHEVIREALDWGTYGINGDQPLSYIKLKDMTTDHIQACLNNVPTMYPPFREAMQAELEYRNKGRMQ